MAEKESALWRIVKWAGGVFLASGGTAALFEGPRAVLVDLARSSGAVAWGWVSGVFRHLGAPSGWPNWLVYLLLVVLALLALVLMVGRMGNARAASAVPGWRSFRSMEFEGIRWHWDYHGMDIGEPFPLCRYCAYELDAEEIPQWNGGWETTFKCGNCNAAQVVLPRDIQGVVRHVQQKIRHQLRTEEWRRHVPGAAKSE